MTYYAVPISRVTFCLANPAAPVWAVADRVMVPGESFQHCIEVGVNVAMQDL